MMEVKLLRRPSTFYGSPLPCRIFYTDREKLVGKLFPTPFLVSRRYVHST